MSYENKDGKGALFRKNKTSEKQPDWSGDVRIQGADFDLAAWIKQSSKGTEYLSLSIKPKGEQKPVMSRKQEIEDDIPF